MLECLCAGSASVSELAEPFPVSLSAIGQHLEVLEKSGLIRTHKAGRVRTVELAPDALTGAEQWFARHRRRWEHRLDRLGALLEEDDEDAAGKSRRRKK